MLAVCDAAHIDQIDVAFVAEDFHINPKENNFCHQEIGGQIQAINDSFGAKLSPVPYEGSGNTKTALYNGEVDYVLLSIKHGRDIMKNGGKCHYEFSNDANSDLVALGTLDKSNKQFIAGYDGVWLAYNMTDDQIENLRSIISGIHNDPSSGMYSYTNGGKNLKVYFDLSSAEIVYRWKSSVANLQE